MLTAPTASLKPCLRAHLPTGAAAFSASAPTSTVTLAAVVTVLDAVLPARTGRGGEGDGRERAALKGLSRVPRDQGKRTGGILQRRLRLAPRGSFPCCAAWLPRPLGVGNSGRAASAARSSSRQLASQHSLEEGNGAREAGRRTDGARGNVVDDARILWRVLLNLIQRLVRLLQHPLERAAVEGPLLLRRLQLLLVLLTPALQARRGVGVGAVSCTAEPAFTQ